MLRSNSQILQNRSSTTSVVNAQSMLSIFPQMDCQDTESGFGNFVPLAPTLFAMTSSIGLSNLEPRTTNHCIARDYGTFGTCGTCDILHDITLSSQIPLFVHPQWQFGAHWSAANGSHVAVLSLLWWISHCKPRSIDEVCKLLVGDGLDSTGFHRLSLTTSLCSRQTHWHRLRVKTNCEKSMIQSGLRDSFRVVFATREGFSSS